MDFPMDFPRFKASSYWGPMETCHRQIPELRKMKWPIEASRRTWVGKNASCQASEKPWILWMKYGIFDDV
jgi:hypothetical protein